MQSQASKPQDPAGEALAEPSGVNTSQLSKEYSKEKLTTDAYADQPLPPAADNLGRDVRDMNIMIRHQSGGKGARKKTPSKSAAKNRGHSRGSSRSGSDNRVPSQLSIERALAQADSATSTQPFAPVGTSQYTMAEPANAEAAGLFEGQYRGYETANEGMDQTRVSFVNDVFSQMRSGKPGWHAKRFKKFPRFSIFLHRDEERDHLEQNYISLNSKILSYLAQ